MDTLAYGKRPAVPAHERGDSLSAARHYQDAADNSRSPGEAEACRKLAEEALAHEDVTAVLLVEW